MLPIRFCWERKAKRGREWRHQQLLAIHRTIETLANRSPTPIVPVFVVFRVSFNNKKIRKTNVFVWNDLRTANWFRCFARPWTKSQMCRYQWIASQHISIARGKGSHWDKKKPNILKKVRLRIMQSNRACKCSCTTSNNMSNLTSMHHLIVSTIGNETETDQSGNIGTSISDMIGWQCIPKHTLLSSNCRWVAVRNGNDEVLLEWCQQRQRWMMLLPTIALSTLAYRRS